MGVLLNVYERCILSVERRPQVWYDAAEDIPERGRMSMKWKNMTMAQRVATIIAGIAVVFWLIPKLQPELLPVDPTYPAIAVVTLCEAVVYWKEKRKWSYLLIAAAVICLGSFALELSLM